MPLGLGRGSIPRKKVDPVNPQGKVAGSSPAPPSARGRSHGGRLDWIPRTVAGLNTLASGGDRYHCGGSSRRQDAGGQPDTRVRLPPRRLKQERCVDPWRLVVTGGCDGGPGYGQTGAANAVDAGLGDTGRRSDWRNRKAVSTGGGRCRAWSRTCASNRLTLACRNGMMEPGGVSGRRSDWSEPC